jgi:hypothetical protein
MAPFEALYGRRCRTPLNWSQAGDKEIFGPDLVLEAEGKVRVIKKNLEATQARQKSYHDKRRKPLQFEVGDHVYLKVSPTKGVCDTPGVSFVLCREIYPNLGCSVKISISRSCLSLFIRLSHGSSPNSELFDREKQPILERIKTFISRHECKLENHSLIINLI